MAKKISQKQFKADDIRMMLEELYPKTPIPLNHKDIYTLFDSCIAFGSMYR